MHAILSTRHDLRLRLHQLRMAGELAEIRGEDLRFTERETRELALGEFRAAGRLQPRLVSSLALASQVTGWTLATQARAGMPAQARAALTALDDENARPGEIRSAGAVICLAQGDPAAALAVVQDVLDGTAPVTGHVTVVEAQLLAGLAHQALGHQHAASQATESALALAEPDRLILPFAVTGSQNLLPTEIGWPIFRADASRAYG